MSKALTCRGIKCFDGDKSTEPAIADYSLALWCDPINILARMDRAAVYDYELYSALPLSDDSPLAFSLPMSLEGAIADAEAAADELRLIANQNRDSVRGRTATRLLNECAKLMSSLQDKRAGVSSRPGSSNQAHSKENGT